jgi:hypothetical protein
MAGASEEHPGDTRIGEPTRTTIYPDGRVTSDSLPEADGPALESTQVYRPLSLLAVLALVLGVSFAVLVLVGGLMPFARSYPRAFVLLLLLGPIAGGLGAVLARQKGAGRIASIAAIGLGAVVVLIGLGGLVAFSSTSPWQLGGWEWVLLLATLLVALIALAQIRAAEGTLAGRECARWGLWLALFFGGYYLLYTAGNVFAVNGQATTVTKGYLELIKEDRLPEAFVESLPPRSRPKGGDLETEVKVAYNAPRGTMQGEYTMFSTSPLVQRIRRGAIAGDKARMTISSRTASAEYTPTGYRATVGYEIRDDLGRFQAEVVAQSVEVEGGKREWQIMPMFCKITREFETTDLGQQLMQASFESRHPRHVSSEWIGALRANMPEYAYLLTLPASQRPPLARAHILAQGDLAGVAGLAPRALLAGLEKELKEVKQGKEALQAGKLLDESQFRTDPALRAEQIREVRDYLKQQNRTVVNAEAVPVEVLSVRSVGDEVEVLRPIRFTVMETGGQSPRYLIEADLICRGTVGNKPLEDRYRVVGLRLLQGVKQAPQQAPPPPPPQ